MLRLIQVAAEGGGPSQDNGDGTLEKILIAAVPAVLAGVGYLIRRRWLDRPTSDVTTRSDKTPGQALLGTAHSYVKVVSEPQISSAPAEAAAARLIEEADAVRATNAAAAEEAYTLARERDRGQASASLAKLKRALEPKRSRWRRLRNRSGG